MITRYKYFPLDFCSFIVKGKDYKEYETLISESKQLFINSELGVIKYSYCQFDGMLLRLYPSGRITLSGSLHKFKNDGLHNYDQFNQSDFNLVLIKLNKEFFVKPSELWFTKFEYGINFPLNFNVKEVLDGLILHKNIEFSKTIKKGMQFYFADHSKTKIKAYNKGLQYGLEKNLMRFEIKQENIDYKIRYELGIKTLEDFVNSDKKFFVNQLIKTWDEIIFLDPSIEALKETKFSLKQLWSKDYLLFNRTSKKRLRDRLNKIINSKKGNLKKLIKVEILKVIDSLNLNSNYQIEGI